MDLRDATIGQLAVSVTDFERALSFYRDKLGLPFLFAAPPQMAFFMAGNVRLLIGTGHPPGGGTAIYFKVADIQATYAELQARGVVFPAPPHAVHRTETYTLWLADFADPDGNPLILMAEVAN